MKIKFYLIFTLSLSLLLSCGKSDGDKGSINTGKRSSPLVQQMMDGKYKAILRPMNNHLSGFLPTGTAEIKIAGDEIEVKTLLDDDAKAPHMQNIHLGHRCPSIADDTNNDDIVDIFEAYKASGNVLIPLDSNLNSAKEGAGIYPVGSSFTYIEKASLLKMEKDISERINQGLNLSGKVVLIHGVAANTQLPSTVGTLEGMTQENSVPIACGIIKRL